MRHDATVSKHKKNKERKREGRKHRTEHDAQVYEMWKELQYGKHAENWFQFGWTTTSAKPLNFEATGTLTDGVWSIRMADCWCGVENARVTLE